MPQRRAVCESACHAEVLTTCRGVHVTRVCVLTQWQRGLDGAAEACSERVRRGGAHSPCGSTSPRVAPLRLRTLLPPLPPQGRCAPAPASSVHAVIGVRSGHGLRRATLVCLQLGREEALKEAGNDLFRCVAALSVWVRVVCGVSDSRGVHPRVSSSAKFEEAIEKYTEAYDVRARPRCSCRCVRS